MITDSQHDSDIPAPTHVAAANPTGAWRAFGGGVLAFFVLSLALFAVAHYYLQSPWWPKNLGLHDVRYFFGPNAFFLDTALNNGEFPLWNPLVYSGMPFAADPQTSAFYPPHLIRSLLTPAYNPYATAVGLEILLVLHLLLGGMGLYVLARAYRLSLWAGIVGALIFMVGPFSIVNSTEFYVFPLTMAWAPWLLWLARKALRAQGIKNTLRYTAWTALCFGVSALVLFPQLTLYMGLMLFFFTLLDGLFGIGASRSEKVHKRHDELSSFPRTWESRTRQGETEPALNPRVRGDDGPQAEGVGEIQSAGSRYHAVIRHALRTTGRGTFLLASVALLGTMIAAVVLLPTLELGRYGVRAVAAGLIVSPWGQDLDWLHLLKCLVVFPGNTWLPQGCRAAGIGSLLALLTAFGHKDRRNVLVFFGMFLLMTDLTLGPPFPVGSMLHAVDFLNITVSPWRAGAFSSLCLAMVVAFGVDAASQACSTRSRGLLRTVMLTGAAVGMLALLTIWVKDKPLFEPNALVWLLPAMTLLAMGLFTWVKRPKLGRAVIALLIGLEIIAWSSQMLPIYVSRRVGVQSTAEFGKTKALWQGNHRTAVTTPNWNLWTLEPASNGYGPMYVGRTRQILCKPSLEKHYRISLKQDEVQVENQRGNLFAKRSFWLARQWVSGPLPPKDHLFPAATTVYLPKIESGTSLSIPEVMRDQVGGKPVSRSVKRTNLAAGEALRKKIRKRKKNVTTVTLPLFQQGFAHSVLYVGYSATGPVDISPTCTDEQGTRYKLFRGQTTDTNGELRFLMFPLPDCQTASITLRWPTHANEQLALMQTYVLKDMADENAHINIVNRAANSVDVELTGLPDDRILTFIDSAYPGWHAQVDGEEAPILLANDGFKAVAVPAGTHRVRFWYQSNSTRIGLVISIATILSLIAIIVGVSRKPTPKRSP